MERKELLGKVSQEINSGRDFGAEYLIHGVPYTIMIQAPDAQNGINIPSIVAIPMVDKNNMGGQIILESNNKETDIMELKLEQAIESTMNMVRIIRNKPGVIVVPMIPSYRDAPYFQQLSKESLELQPEDKDYRMDEQIVRIVEKTKRLVKETRGIELEDKIFLNGYSSSGVFAQRFALLHPELVNAACIGGASGSIPIPNEELSYPLGIAGYKELTGKEFDMDSYKKITFTYYVGELEGTEKDLTRFDEDGNPAPMHDMSYFNKSIPRDVGMQQRNLLGRNLIERANKTVDILKAMGIKISHTIVPGREHNNLNGKGIKEIGDKTVDDAYRESLEDRQFDFGEQ